MRGSHSTRCRLLMAGHPTRCRLLMAGHPTQTHRKAMLVHDRKRVLNALSKRQRVEWAGRSDPATWTLHQWVRMPNGTRWAEDPDRSRPATLIGPQRLEYFNPNY